jgi:hypothetical protein
LGLETDLVAHDEEAFEIGMILLDQPLLWLLDLSYWNDITGSASTLVIGSVIGIEIEMISLDQPLLWLLDLS